MKEKNLQRFVGNVRIVIFLINAMKKIGTIAKRSRMKSFDEVTKALSICGRHSDCEGCPYENISYPTEIGNTCKDIMHYDTLHYLKTIETTENLYHDAVNELSKWKDEDWKDRCLPLTWDELRQMEGKPIWLEEIEDDKILFGQWDIVSGFSYSENFDLIDYENTIIDFYRSGNRTKFGLCKSWQAYRKERK